MNELINKIGLDETLEKEVSRLIKEKEQKINLLADKCEKHGFNALSNQNDLTRLAVCLKYAERTKEKYDALNIDEKIFYDTMSDIRIWCENNDNKGMRNFRWIKNHLCFELFRLGRLQFQLYTCNNPSYDYSLLPFDKGEKVIFIHIPQGERLNYSDCVSSLKAANEFFAAYFENYEYRFYICESWLLYEDNYLFMKPGSNILQFQSLFDIAMSKSDDRQTIERIFGKRRLLKSRYPERTELQRSAKKFMQNGNKAGIGLGIIDKEEI